MGVMVIKIQTVKMPKLQKASCTTLLTMNLNTMGSFGLSFEATKELGKGLGLGYGSGLSYVVKRRFVYETNTHPQRQVPSQFRICTARAVLLATQRNKHPPTKAHTHTHSPKWLLPSHAPLHQPIPFSDPRIHKYTSTDTHNTVVP